MSDKFSHSEMKYETGELHYESFSLNNQLHNENGPAWIAYLKDGSISAEAYYLNGTPYHDPDIKNNWKAFCHLQLYK